MNAARIPQIEELYDLPVSFPSLMDEIPIGVVLLDPDCRIVFVNRSLEGFAALPGCGRSTLWRKMENYQSTLPKSAEAAK